MGFVHGASDKQQSRNEPITAELNDTINALHTANIGLQPDGDAVINRADGQFFADTTLLVAGSTFTSEWYDHDGFGMIELFIKTDVPSVNRGVVIEWTNDAQAEPPVVEASDEYEFTEANVRSGYLDLHLRPVLDGFRIKYTNGDEDQANTLITAVGRTNPEVGFENSGNAIVVADFAREVALGNVANYSQSTKFGRNPDIDSGQPADIWNGGRGGLGSYEYSGFNATQNENIETYSASANDSGALVSSGSITTTMQDKVIDSGATFITDGVSVGDIVLNDTRGTYGYVTSIDSETQLSVFNMQNGRVGTYTNISSNQYRVATTNGTGAAVVTWKKILNSDFERQTDVFVILNGTTPVTTTVDAYRLSLGDVLLAGSGGENDGEITCRQATTTANVFSVIGEGANKTLICAGTVPKDAVYLIETVQPVLAISGGTNTSGVVSLRVRPFGGVFESERVFDLTSGGGAYQDEEVGGIVLPEGTDFKMRVDSVSANNTRVSAKIEFLEIDET